MIRRVAVLALAALTGAGASSSAQQASRFTHERQVTQEATGPRRLDIDVPLLAAGRPFTVSMAGDRAVATGGLQDLRFFTPDGTEVPYLLVRPPAPSPVWVPARVLPVAATEKASGMEVDLGQVLAVDGVRLRTVRPPYLKRFRLEASGDRERWTLLVSEGTAYDLPKEGLRQDAIDFDATECRYLRFTWDDTNSARVVAPPTIEVRRSDATTIRSAPLRLPVAFERRASEPGFTRVAVRLPGARLPVVALDLTVASGHVLRTARVLEAGLSGRQAVPKLLGTAVLRRIEREGMQAESLTVPIGPPNEAQIELVVEDGDNPPLDLLAVNAVFAELPWIYLERIPPGLTARWGDPTLAAPRYDLEAARESVSATAVVAASWGPSSELPAPPDLTGLPMPDTGATLGADRFRYVRSLPSGDQRLVTVPLDAAVLAHSTRAAGTFQDLRVVDDDGRQIPYLLERRDGPLVLDAGLERKPLPEPLGQVRGPRTTYRLSVPFDTLPQARISVETRARVFRRRIELAWIAPPDGRRRQPALQMIAISPWEHADETRPAPPLVLMLPPRPGGELFLLVDEGDNRPLPLERAMLLLPAYAVRLFRPGDRSLRMAYGRADLQQPEYDLALLAPQVLGRVATEVATGPEEDRGAAPGPGAIVSPPVFWAAMIAAVLVLLVIIGRLLRAGAGS